MINIAIDGYAGSGKSTIANALAARLGIKILNTGKIYRGLACAYRDMYGPDIIINNILGFIKNIKVEVFFEGDIQRVVVNGKDYTSHLHEEEISNNASLISAYKEIRESVLSLQRQFAEQNDCILEGRDIGTIVLPNADLKLFITADVDIRAKRRFADLIASGETVTLNEVAEDIKIRDYNDTHREIAPLCQAEDATVVDTSKLSLEEAVEHCLNIVKSKLQIK